jgi:uncharacterized membrane protein (DUF373 family)
LRGNDRYGHGAPGLLEGWTAGYHKGLEVFGTALSARILELLLADAVDPANQGVFQTVFGMIMTVLIALEFKHSMLGVLERRHSVIQVRTVVLIALLALVRKFIIIDATKTEPLTLIGLSLAVLALGGVYWLVREQDDRKARATGEPDADFQREVNASGR